MRRILEEQGSQTSHPTQACPGSSPSHASSHPEMANPVLPAIILQAPPWAPLLLYWKLANKVKARMCNLYGVDSEDWGPSV